MSKYLDSYAEPEDHSVGKKLGTYFGAAAGIIGAAAYLFPQAAAVVCGATAVAVAVPVAFALAGLGGGYALVTALNKATTTQARDARPLLSLAFGVAVTNVVALMGGNVIYGLPVLTSMGGRAIGLGLSKLFSPPSP